MLDLSLLVVGLAGVAYCAKLTLDHAIVIAHHHRIPDFYLGLIILAVGSDLPELVVTINAAIRNLGDVDTSGLIVGNVVGSCFGQIGLTLGIAGTLGQMTIERDRILRHGQVLLASLLALFLTGLDGTVTRIEGGVLTVLFALYLMSLADSMQRPEPRGETAYRAGRTWGLLTVGMLGVVLAAELIVRSAVSLATVWGVSQSFIAIAVIGVGTSIPELSISVAALRRGRGAMSVGNLIGSNILDTLLPVGLAALITPVAFEAGLLAFDVPALFTLSLIVCVFFLIRPGLQRREAMSLVALYVLYITVKVGSA